MLTETHHYYIFLFCALLVLIMAVHRILLRLQPLKLTVGK